MKKNILTEKERIYNLTHNAAQAWEAEIPKETDVVPILGSIKCTADYMVSNLGYDTRALFECIRDAHKYALQLKELTVDDRFNGIIEDIEILAEYAKVDISIYDTVKEENAAAAGTETIKVADVYFDFSESGYNPKLIVLAFEGFKDLGFVKSYDWIELEDEIYKVENLEVFKDNAQKFVQYLDTISRYFYINGEMEHYAGWDFRNLRNEINQALSNTEGTDRQKAFELAKYLYNSICFENPEPDFE
jgi:hypothetical protein|nr:MAG TPA: hypothetical protein [Caudoviricetes sp.]